MDSSRKRRSDEGRSVFNCPKRRDSTYTPLDNFKRRKRFDNPGEPFDPKELRIEFEQLTGPCRIPYERGAEEMKQIVASSQDEIGRLLRQTRGQITWRTLADKLSGDGPLIVNKSTVMNFVMSLPDSSYTTTRILPMLTAQTKKFRYEWAKSFHILWHGGRMVTPKVQLVLVQSDEKWFFSLVVRQNLKCIPFFGCKPVDHAVHHKNHIGKILVFVMTAFVPKDNDFEKGGNAHKILIERAGGMVKAKKHSFRRVYREDGTYHYPKLKENRLRKKGDEYFQNWEITGSNEGTLTNRKFSLLKMTKEKSVPNLDSFSQRLGSETGKKIVVVEQDDNATPHRDKQLREYKEEQYAVRDWILMPQPPNSPLTNVQDAGFFPAMAKLVTEHQGLFNGSHYLQGEALWKAVKRVYEDYDIKKLSQLYMHHGQIVNAILKCKGGDEFVKESKALHCGVRSIVQPVYDNEESKTPCGVEILESLSPIDVAAKLRYKRPNVSKQFWEAASHEDDHDFNPKKYLSRHMLELFCENSVDDDLEHQYFSEALRELNEADENANNEEGNSDGNGNNGEDGSGSNSGSQNDNNNGGGGRNNDDRNDSDLQGCHF